jgi:catechol 2,3-dioxygenase-like lactoylglutathione lyase family enzyme
MRRPPKTQKKESRMIGVKKIAHATYETPDLDQQIEYYTDILGLGLIAREKDAAYLASTIDHHSVVLLKGGGDSARCVRIGFQLGIDDDIDAFEKQTAAHGIKIVRKKDPGALDCRDGELRGSQGYCDGGV